MKTNDGAIEVNVSNIVVYKYQLEITDVQTLQMPPCQILSVANQRGTLCLWALVDSRMNVESRKVLIIGTGNPIDVDINDFDFVGTVIMDPYVWHVWIEIHSRSTNTQETPDADESE